MFRFTTAGESHGQALVCILEGMPAGLPLLAADVNAQLARRQQGYGRGRRMQIEHDEVQLLSGVRAGETTGAPIAMMIINRDWKNWAEIMDPAPRQGDPDPRRRAVTRPRPGHADLTGMLKYDRGDARDILERASARETTARVAAGSICRKLLSHFGVTIGSHLVHLGGIDALPPNDGLPSDINAAADVSPLRTLDREAELRMIAAIDAAKAAGDTLGGICEIVAGGLPPGLGSHVSWDRKLDARIGAAILSIPAVKGVEIGIGFEAARRRGSAVHDEIELAPDRSAGGVRRRTNRAGGLEGGMTTGEPLVVRAAMKPISTLMKPLATVDVKTGEAAAAVAERSDITAVPAMGVIAEAMIAFVLAQAWLEKFGGDSVVEQQRNVEGYLERIAERLSTTREPDDR
ncbi:MAG: chorismate synthase [Gemmatimonadota bacterium]